MRRAIFAERLLRDFQVRDFQAGMAITRVGHQVCHTSAAGGSILGVPSIATSAKLARNVSDLMLRSSTAAVSVTPAPKSFAVGGAAESRGASATDIIRGAARDCAPFIPRLTRIADSVSLEVRQQYEENPYPRWVTAAPAGRPTTVCRYLQGLFPLAPINCPDESSGVDILVAGCGTGQHSIATAQRYVGAGVLAVDLSIASLCYAKGFLHHQRLSRPIVSCSGASLHLAGHQRLSRKGRLEVSRF